MRHDCMELMLVSNQSFIVPGVDARACVPNYTDYYTINFEFRRIDESEVVAGGREWA